MEGMKTEEDAETAGSEEGLRRFGEFARDPERLLGLARREMELARLCMTPMPEAFEVRLRREGSLTFLETRSPENGRWASIAQGRSPEQLFREWRDFVLRYWRDHSGISSLEELVLEMDARGIPG